MTVSLSSIRASEADIVVNCGKAAQPPDQPIDISGPEAALGSAVHDSAEPWVNNGFQGELEPQPYANQHGVDPQAVAELIDKAPEAIRQIKADLTNAKAEVKIDSGQIRGRIDVLALRMAGSRLFSATIIDWKTGRDPTGSKPNQRLAYASAVYERYGMPAQPWIYAAEIWLATGDIIEARYDEAMIKGFQARLADRLKRPTAAPGGHCRYCRRRHECTERQAWLRLSALEMAEVPPQLATPDALASLWDQSRALRSMLEQYEKAVDMAIEENNGLPLPDGRRLVHKTMTRDTIDARKAWPIMRKAGLDQDAINQVLSISKTKLLEQIAKPVARGGKQEAKAAIITALDEAGAIERKVLKRRTII